MKKFSLLFILLSLVSKMNALQVAIINNSNLDLSGYKLCVIYPKNTDWSRAKSVHVSELPAPAMLKNITQESFGRQVPENAYIMAFLYREVEYAYHRVNHKDQEGNVSCEIMDSNADVVAEGELVFEQEQPNLVLYIESQYGDLRIRVLS